MYCLVGQGVGYGGGDSIRDMLVDFTIGVGWKTY
jgi:hypothetical protein